MDITDLNRSPKYGVLWLCELELVRCRRDVAVLQCWRKLAWGGLIRFSDDSPTTGKTSVAKMS
jgi:hypothetical protein